MLYSPKGQLTLDTQLLSKKRVTFLLPNEEALKIFQGSAGGMPEASLIEWSLTDVLPKGKTFIDIGAHVGTYALSFARQCPQVFAFECQENTYYHLCAGIALNGLKNVVAHRVALSDGSESSGELRIISVDGGGSSVVSDLPTHRRPLTTERVELRTLDSFGLENIGLIKIDVEGGELAVLRGAVETLQRNDYPKILFEAWPDEWYAERKVELFDFLKKLGYTIIPILGYPQMFLAERLKKPTKIYH
jgi:FkbM family methyltransferase